MGLIEAKKDFLLKIKDVYSDKNQFAKSILCEDWDRINFKDISEQEKLTEEENTQFKTFLNNFTDDMNKKNKNSKIEIKDNTVFLPSHKILGFENGDPLSYLKRTENEQTLKDLNEVITATEKKQITEAKETLKKLEKLSEENKTILNRTKILDKDEKPVTVYGKNWHKVMKENGLLDEHGKLLSKEKNEYLKDLDVKDYKLLQKSVNEYSKGQKNSVIRDIEVLKTMDKLRDNFSKEKAGLSESNLKNLDDVGNMLKNNKNIQDKFSKEELELMKEVGVENGFINDEDRELLEKMGNHQNHKRKQRTNEIKKDIQKEHKKINKTKTDSNPKTFDEFYEKNTTQPVKVLDKENDLNATMRNKLKI